MIREILAFITESEGDLSGEDELKMLSAQPEDRIYTLDDIKAVEPFFFNRRAMRFHGTKKIYKYGNYIVVYNKKQNRAPWGQVSTTEEYVIYEFRITDDNPQGFLLKRGDTDELADAKKMIKTKDFRSWRHRILNQESRPFQVQVHQFSKDEASSAGYDISEIEEFPVMHATIDGAYLDYEESDTTIWILMVATEGKLQNQGRAKYLLDYIRRYAEQNGKRVIHGTFTEDGEKYLKHVVNRLWPEQN